MSIIKRRKLSEIYPIQREDICNKILHILDLNENQTFLLSDLENNIDKQNQILALKDDIRKYFACSTISSFKLNFECKRPYLNLIRSILRQQGYTFDCGTTFTKLDMGIYKTSTKYKVFRKMNN